MKKEELKDFVKKRRKALKMTQETLANKSGVGLHFIRDMDFVLDIIKRDYPEMYRYALEYINRNKGYFCNMFIMKKDIFFRYSEWLFSILKEHEKNIDI